MTRQIVLFGGTFDPVHFGHLITARAVAERCGFDRITLMPAACPPHKSPAQASAQQRLAMLDLAVRDDPLFEISQLELHRTGPSYTLDTLQALQAQHGVQTRLYWVIGADMLDGLDDWHRVKEVLDLAGIVVAARPPWDQRIESLLAGLEQTLGTQQMRRIRPGIVPTPLIDISSTDIRRRVKEARPIRYLVPESVMSYIEANRLYL